MRKRLPKPFTKEELQQILDTPNSELRDLAIILGRSVDSLKRKKYRLLNREKDAQARVEYKKKKQQETLDMAASNNSRWTVAEEEFLLTTTLSDIQAAKELKRTLQAVQIKRKRLLEEKKNGSRSRNSKGRIKKGKQENDN